MAYKDVLRVDIAEVIRRWQAGISRRQIASGTGLSRETVGKYIAAAEGMGVSREGAAPTEEQLSCLAAISRPGPQQASIPTEEMLAPWADQIYQWLTVDRLRLTRVQELLAQRGSPVSYPSLHRFVARRNWRGHPPSTVRMEGSAPGEVAEVDFGRLGLIHDPDTGRRRTVWALVPSVGLFEALFRLAHLQPEAGGRDRRNGIGLGLLRRHPQVPCDGQFPCCSGWGRCPAPQAHPRLPRVFPAPRLHLRSGQGAPPQGQAEGRTGVSSMSGSGSSRAGSSGTWPMSGIRRSAGAGTSPASGFTAPPGASP